MANSPLRLRFRKKSDYKYTVTLEKAFQKQGDLLYWWFLNTVEANN